MAWVKLDDRFYQHPKILTISNAAFRLYISGLCYSSLYQTDGKLLPIVAESLLANFACPAIDQWNNEEVISELTRSGLWETHDGHYMIHDFLEYNMCKEEREKLAELRAKSGKKGGLAKGKQLARLRLEHRDSKKLANEGTYQTPSPSPSPSQTEDKKTTTPSPPRALPEESPWGTPVALALKYNREATDNCPAVTELSPKRKEKATRFLRMFPDESWWTLTFQMYHRSRFLSGKAQPGNGHATFQPDFDWLLSVGKDGTENAVKVHDGRYCDANRPDQHITYPRLQ